MSKTMSKTLVCSIFLILMFLGVSNPATAAQRDLPYDPSQDPSYQDDLFHYSVPTISGERLLLTAVAQQSDAQSISDKNADTTSIEESGLDGDWLRLIDASGEPVESALAIPTLSGERLLISSYHASDSFGIGSSRGSVIVGFIPYWGWDPTGGWNAVRTYRLDSGNMEQSFPAPNSGTFLIFSDVPCTVRLVEYH